MTQIPSQSHPSSSEVSLHEEDASHSSSGCFPTPRGQGRSAPGGLEKIPPLRIPAETATNEASVEANCAAGVGKPLLKPRSVSDYGEDESDIGTDNIGVPTAVLPMVPGYHHLGHSGMPMGSSAPALRREPSGSAVEESLCRRGGSELASDRNLHENESDGRCEEYMRFPSYSWRETLAHIPGLLDRYPLAASSENQTMGEDNQGVDAENAQQSPAPAYVQWEGNENEEYLNGVVQPGAVNDEHRSQSDQVSPTEAATGDHGPEARNRLEDVLPQTSPKCAEVAERIISATSGEDSAWYPDNGRVAAALGVSPVHTASRGYQCLPEEETPRMIPSARSRRSDNTRPQSAGATRRSRESMHPAPLPCASRVVGPGGPDRQANTLEAAWAEVRWMHRRLTERERDLAQRELVVRRSEARNKATARQLAELRRRLDDYGQELEEGVLALTAQQQAFREGRRRTSDSLPASGRPRITTARDIPVSSKLREWSGTGWSPHVMPT